jgi:CAAX protease family protein
MTPRADRSPGLTLRFWFIAVGLEVFFGLALLVVGDAALQRGLNATGLKFNTDAVTAARLIIGYPASTLAVLLSVGAVAAPDIAVLVVTWRRRGADGLTAVRRRFRFWAPEVGRRRGVRIWAAMAATFIGASLATAGLDAWLLPASDWRWHGDWGPNGLVLGLLVAMFLDLGAVFEENGWRGYALPRLLTKHSPVVASLILGLMWAAWHYPVKYDAFTTYGVAGVWYLAAFTIKILVLTVVMTYFWQRAGQATILAIAMHGLSNDSLRLQGDLIGDSSLRTDVFSELTITVPLLAVALVLVLRTRGRLGALLTTTGAAVGTAR